MLRVSKHSAMLFARRLRRLMRYAKRGEASLGARGGGVQKFEHRAPAAQNAIDIFAGHWNADLSALVPGVKAGTSDMFTADPRPAQAAQALGRDGRFDGMNILELGPLEGAHGFALERLGAASVLSLEANIEAFMKCLIVKELLNLKKIHFMLGDVVEFFKANTHRFDLIFCSGILYHMEDPIELIGHISKFTNKCFVWTHYYDENHCPGPPRRPLKQPGGQIYYQRDYPDRDYGKFWGGNRPVSSWLRKDDILDAFSLAGLKTTQIIAEDLDHPGGACFTFAASR